MAHQKKRNRQEKTILESATTLRSRIGDTDDLPRSISFNSGKKVQIQTNTYKMQLGTQSKIIQYSVKFDPEVLNTKSNLHFVYSAVCGVAPGPMSTNEKWRYVIYDEGGIIYSTLKDLNTVVDVTAGQNKSVKVTIEYVKELSNSDVEPLLAVYNTALHKAYKSFGLEPFRQKWIDEKSKKSTGSFAIFSGYRPTVMNLSSGLSFVVDMTTRIDRQDSLYYYLRPGIRDPVRREDLERSCKGFQLQTTHLKKNKGVVVKRIEWGKSPNEISFLKVDKKTLVETQITIAQYFFDTYGFKCQDDDVLVIQSAGSRETIYPSSCLKATGISDAERKDRHVMQDISSFTRVDPKVRKEKLDHFVSSLRDHASASKFLSEWNIHLGEGQTLDGYIIEPPSLQFGARGNGNSVLTLTEKLTFQNELKNFALSAPPDYTSSCLIIYPEENSRLIKDDFVNSLKKVSNGLGLSLPPIECQGISEQNPGPHFYVQVVITFIKQINKRPSFVVFVLPTTMKQRYDVIKQYMVVTFGIPSQVFVLEKLRQGKISDSVTTNVAIQIASKTLGVPYHILSLPAPNVMLIGLAVTGGRMGQPICGIISTYNQKLTQYQSATTSCIEKVAPADFLYNFVTSSLEYFKDMNNTYPNHVVVYRDGVSYGMMKNVKQGEVDAIQRAINEKSTPSSTISLSVLVAQKHAAIRILEGENASNSRNVAPGTVVTGSICVSSVAEFYMVSHNANQGSANPTRYTLIHQFPSNCWGDGNKLITLTHYLTLHYPNWAGAIRIPAILMLASRLAEFSKSHLSSQDCNGCIKKTLYFL